jgi:NifU-like protein involved in Fe-S cluster formation
MKDVFVKESMNYSPLVLELFDRRPHVGRMPEATDVYLGRGRDAARGVDVQIWIKYTLQRIQATSFLAYGCPHTVAATSWWAQRVRGLQIDDAKQVIWQEAERALAVPPEKRGKLLVIEDAVRLALNAASAA